MREHGTITTSVFLSDDGEASWSLLPSLVSLLSGDTLKPRNTYPVSEGNRSALRKPTMDKNQH